MDEKFRTWQEELRYLVFAADRIAGYTDQAVRQALDEGASYAEVGAVLGISRQAVRQRFGAESSGVKGSKTR